MGRRAGTAIACCEQGKGDCCLLSLPELDQRSTSHPRQTQPAGAQERAEAADGPGFAWLGHVRGRTVLVAALALLRQVAAAQEHGCCGADRAIAGLASAGGNSRKTLRSDLLSLVSCNNLTEPACLRHPRLLCTQGAPVVRAL